MIQVQQTNCGVITFTLIPMNARRFAQVSHEYLIEQVQENDLSNPTGSSDLTLNHPVKELFWTSAGWDLVHGGIDDEQLVLLQEHIN